MDEMECMNELWVAENPGHTIEWARTMWWCDCPKCPGLPERNA